MITLGSAALTIALIAGVLLAFALLTVLALRGDPEDRVGPWRKAPPVEPERDSAPWFFASMAKSEADGWPLATWSGMLNELDRLEVRYGGSSAKPWPVERDLEWLEWRIARIEELAGPMPAVMPEASDPPKPRSIWRRLFP